MEKAIAQQETSSADQARANAPGTLSAAGKTPSGGRACRGPVPHASRTCVCRGLRTPAYPAAMIFLLEMELLF